MRVKLGSFQGCILLLKTARCDAYLSVFIHNQCTISNGYSYNTAGDGIYIIISTVLIRFLMVIKLLCTLLSNRLCSNIFPAVLIAKFLNDRCKIRELVQVKPQNTVVFVHKCPIGIQGD